jgi:hypothetical protein
VTSYGAQCNSSAISGGGTDDTAAFTSAATAAGAAYSTTGVSQVVTLPAGSPCRVDGTVTIGSGVVFEGPGAIVVTNQTVYTLLFVNADYSGVENLTVRVLAGTAGNTSLSAVHWTDTASDTAAHIHFFARNNTVIDGDWGIYVFYGNGTGSLQDVDISGNTIISRSVYTNNDGIHVNGNVHGITINGNRVSNRGDAAIALTSGPGASRTLSGAVVSNNLCLNDITGLDNSGASNVIWSNNYVQSTAPISNYSNPAARSIVYVGLTPQNVKFIGNYLQNYQGTGTDPVAKVDDTGSNAVTNVEWASNTLVGAYSLWLAANTVAVHDNIFSPNATIDVEYDPYNNYPGQNIMIGANYWMSSGTINATGNPGLYINNSVAKQQANGTITINDTPAGITTLGVLAW